MKYAKLSLAALLALGVSAFADVNNIKVSGDAKLFYATQDGDNNQIGIRPATGDLFSKNNSAGQAALDLAVEADLADSAKGKVAITALNTLGLENNLVSNVWEGGLGNQWWVSEAWLAKSIANTTIKVGRQAIDTPLAFSETWSIAQNTFDAAVVLNSDVPNTTLVAAWIGRGNNASGVLGRTGAGTYTNIVRNAANGADPFVTFGTNGAYAVGAINNSIENVTLQAWYYDVQQIARAYWLEADVKNAVPNFIFGAQYANLNPDNEITPDESSAWALKVGYDFKDAVPGLKACVSYSSTDDDGVVNIANTAGTQSKLYTEAWWNYGYVSAPATDAYNITVKYDMKDVAEFGAYYTSTDQDKAKNVTMPYDMTEFTLTATKSYGSLNTTLAYIYTDADNQNVDANGNADSYNTVQVYLTYNF
ncbi:hypothetical protein [Nitrosophilus alvini]|uniref:hypothetical protein n=1 Tax=Nitrosophilus alvini TaxID=2714855 RepID=UPI00190BB4E7|nr:hypothetical protein [Nitrosophilus alvini]